MQSGEVSWAADGTDATLAPEVDPAARASPVPLQAHDQVCWGDPRTGELLEGIVLRTFDTFAEVQLLDSVDTRTMVYLRRLARVASD